MLRGAQHDRFEFLHTFMGVVDAEDSEYALLKRL